MKKLPLLALTALLFSCYSTEDPLKYKGCVVVGKVDCGPMFGNLYLKLSPEFRKQYGEDYMWIGVPGWELDKLNKGDTIR